MEQTQCSGSPAHKIQHPGNKAKEINTALYSKLLKYASLHRTGTVLLSGYVKCVEVYKSLE